MTGVNPEAWVAQVHTPDMPSLLQIPTKMHHQCLVVKNIKKHNYRIF